MFSRITSVLKSTAQKLAAMAEPTPRVGFNPDAKMISFHPIGYIESCFKFKNGTPRQGLVAPEAPSKLKVLTSNAFHSLQSLDQYSHAWIVFWFHDNLNIKTPNKPTESTTTTTSTQTTQTTQTTETQTTDSKEEQLTQEVAKINISSPKDKKEKSTKPKKHPNHFVPEKETDEGENEFDAFPNNNDKYMPYKHKVRPPRLNGKKVGLFATRTPHRPVPIGLTLAKIDKIVGDTVYFKGADLIDGTPVVDIKPYIPNYDSVPDATAPEWISTPSPLTSIEFKEAALQSLNDYLPRLKHFKGIDQLKQTIEDVVLSDIRSVYRKKKCADELFGFHLDKLNIQCTVEGSQVNIVNIEYVEENEIKE